MNDTPPVCVNCGQPITDNAIHNRWGAYHLDERHCLAAALARAELAEAEAAALRARVAELEEHLTGDIQAVTSDGQQHRIRRGNWRPYPASLLE